MWNILLNWHKVLFLEVKMIKPRALYDGQASTTELNLYPPTQCRSFHFSHADIDLEHWLEYYL